MPIEVVITANDTQGKASWEISPSTIKSPATKRARGIDSNQLVSPRRNPPPKKALGSSSNPAWRKRNPSPRLASNSKAEPGWSKLNPWGPKTAPKTISSTDVGMRSQGKVAEIQATTAIARNSSAWCSGGIKASTPQSQSKAP